MESKLWRQSFFGWLIRNYYKLRWIRIKYIPGSELLWRTVFNRHQIKEDGSLKSSFFRDQRGVSCDLVKLTSIKKAIEPRGNPSFWIQKTGLVEFTVDSVRRLSHDSDVIHDPQKEYKNYAHCIFTTKLTKAQARELIRKTKFRVKPVY